MSTTATPETAIPEPQTTADNSTAATTAEATTATTPPPPDPWQDCLERWATELRAVCQTHIDGQLREPTAELWRSIYGTLLAVCAEPALALEKSSWRMAAAANKLAVAAAAPYCTTDGHFRGLTVRDIHAHDLTRPALDLVDAIRDRRNGPPQTITTVHKLPSVEELEKSGCEWTAVCLALGLHRIMGRMPTSNEWFDIKRGEHPTVKVPTTRTTTCQSKPWPDCCQRLHSTAWGVQVLAKVLEIPNPPRVEDLL